MALARPQRMFAQERKTVLDGVAGDVIGAALAHPRRRMWAMWSLSRTQFAHGNMRVRTQAHNCMHSRLR